MQRRFTIPNSPRRCVVRLTAVLVACVLLAAGSMADAAAPATAQRILLVTIDGARAELANAEGMPALSRLSRSGVHVRGATTPTTVTFAATAAVLTGAAPSTNGVRNEATTALDAGTATLAERLTELGYATSALPGDFLCHAKSGVDRGFDTFVLEAPGMVEAERAGAALELIGRDGRQFVWLGLSMGQPVDVWLRSLAGHLQTAAAYESRASELDRTLAAVTDGLRDRGLLESTLVIVTGTHGHGIDGAAQADNVFAETPLPGRGVDLSEDVLRVPLVLHWPAALEPAATAVTSWVSTLDIAGTVVEAAGGTAPFGDGLSLWDGADAEPFAGRVLIHENDVARSWGWRPRAAARRGVVKLTGAGDERLVARAGDQPHAAGEAEMETVLAAHLAAMPDPIVRSDAGDEASAAATIDTEHACYLEYTATMWTDSLSADLDLVAKFGAMRSMCPESALLAVEEARAASFAGGDHTGAALLLRVIETAPHLPEVVLAYSDHLFRYQRFDIAILQLTTAEPAALHASERVWRAAIAHSAMLKDVDLAETALVEAAVVGPPPGEAWLTAAELARDVNRSKRFFDEEPERPALLMRYGRSLCEFGLYRAGFVHLNKARLASPDDPEPDYWIGHYLIAEGRPERAVPAFARCLEIDPNHVPALRELADAHVLQGQFAEATDYLERAVALDGSDPTARYNLACLLAIDGRVDEAMRELEAAVDGGYANWDHILGDADLEPLRALPAYQGLLARAPRAPKP